MISLTINITREEDLSYPILIGRNILNNLVSKVNDLIPSSIVIVTDKNVARLHLKHFEENMKNIPIPIYIIVIPSGEKYKTRKIKEKIENEMLKLKVDRKAVLIAFGGGVIGDLAGFVAATYHRGIKFIQVPTTLLAMVDSSIGGKVAIDTPYGKNTIGAFYQPKSVIIDTTFLDTLPDIQFKNGLVEILKHSIIKDKEFYNFLLQNSNNIIKKDEEILIKVIEWSCRIKKEVVEKDEKEEGLRKILNFGHTIGHAIELLENYKLLHGLAVSVGIAVESLIAVKLNILSNDEYINIINFLKTFNLPTTFREIGVNLSQKKIIQLIDFMQGDKKVVSKEIKMSLPKRIGEMVGSYVITIEPSIIIEAIKESNNL